MILDKIKLKLNYKNHGVIRRSFNYRGGYTYWFFKVKDKNLNFDDYFNLNKNILTNPDRRFKTNKRNRRIVIVIQIKFKYKET